MPVGSEHRQRLEQIVECRGARAQQRVARRRQRELLGPVLGDHHQPAIGERLRDDPQMRTVRQRPSFFMRLVALEPLGQFVAPGGEVADFGDAAILAGNQQHLLEGRAVVDHARWQREHAVEWLVGEGHAVRRIELRHPDRQLVEHRALRLAESTEFAGLLLHFLDIDRITGNALAHQRQVGHPDGAPRAVNGRADDALDRLAPVCGLLRDLGRRPAIDRFDQLDLFGDHPVRAVRADRFDIGLVDQPQLHVRPAEPHRHRRRLDQPDQRAEILACARGFLAQLQQFPFAFAEIEDPDQRRPAGRNRGVCQRPLHRQRLARARRHGDRHAERLGGFLRAAHVARQIVHLRFGQAAAVRARQFGHVFGDLVEPDPARQPVGCLDPPVGADQQRDRGGFLDQARKALRNLPAGDRFLLASARAQHRPDCTCGP